jgi:hypothetical protein
MQKDFVNQGGSLLVPDAEATVAGIIHLLELARASGSACRLRPGHPWTG